MARISHFGSCREIKPKILCTKYPFVSNYQRNSLKQALAHDLLSGTVKPCFCLESGLTTNIGLTDKISIFYKPFSNDIDSEK